MICLICNKEFNNRTALCNHLSRKHNMKKQAYYDTYLKSENEGICKYDGCNNNTSFLDIENGYKDCCCLEHTNLYRYGVKSNLNFKETQEKAQRNSHTKEANEKGLQTRIKRYGGSGFSSKETKQKIVSTMIDRYGQNNPWKVKECQDRGKQTRLDKYGNSNFNNRAKAKQTCIDRYGVDSPIKNKDIQNKMKQTMLERYGVEYSTQSDIIKQKRIETCQKRYNVAHFVQSIEYANSKVKHKKFSKIEQYFIDKLNKLGIEYIAEYKNFTLYPYFCDFYLPDYDMYIELHCSWMHGGHRYTGSKEDLKRIENWQNKGTAQYKKAINVWTKSDVEKLNCAIKNKLNYFTLYNKDEIDMFINQLESR